MLCDNLFSHGLFGFRNRLACNFDRLFYHFTHCVGSGFLNGFNYLGSCLCDLGRKLLTGSLHIGLNRRLLLLRSLDGFCYFFLRCGSFLWVLLRNLVWLEIWCEVCFRLHETSFRTRENGSRADLRYGGLFYISRSRCTNKDGRWHVAETNGTTFVTYQLGLQC